MDPKTKQLADAVIAAVRPFVKQLAEQRTQLDKASVTLETVERRLSRQGQHLAELQTKLTKLERK